MIRKLVICVLALILLQSCVSLALKAVGADAKKAKPRYISSSNKEVVFIGMHHIGKKEFYNDVNSLTERKGKEGFVSYYESVKDDTMNIESEKKMRKILGFYIPKEGYLDTVNNMLMGKIKVSESYINQPKANELISPHSKAKKVDVNLSRLIRAYEKDYGEVVLDSCDRATSLDRRSYKCASYRKDRKEDFKTFKDKYVLEYRNKYLATSINNSKHDKIIVVYGRAHYKGLLEELIKLDDSWEEN